MALSTARILVLRGRPPGLAGGINGSISSHWESVKSLGYPNRRTAHLLPERFSLPAGAPSASRANLRAWRRARGAGGCAPETPRHARASDPDPWAGTAGLR